MKNKCLRSLLLLLTVLLMLGMMAGCNKDEPTDTETTTAEEPLPVKEEAHIAVSELKDYVLVIPQDAGEAFKQAAMRFRTAMEETYGVMNTIIDDEYRFFAKEQTVKPHEILIGRTNREETTAFLKTLSYGEAGHALIGEKLVLCGSTEEQTVSILEQFANQMQKGEVFYSNQNDCIVPMGEAVSKKDQNVAGIPLSDYTIVYTDTDYFAEADRFYHEIGKETGVCLPVVRSIILDSKNPIPGILFASVNKVDKKLSPLDSYGFADYGYSIKKLGEAPQVIVDGTSLYSLTLSGREFVSMLSAGADMSVDTTVKKSAVEEDKSKQTEKTYPVDGLKLPGGEVSQYRIVYAEEKTGKTAFAAQELANYIQKATGVTVPVVPDTEDAVNDNEIVVGITSRDTENVKTRRAKLENDGIIYYMEGNRLFLTSHTDAGQIYAVYHFLEDYLGCRFYAADFETIHPLGVVELPANLDYSYSSPFFYRQTDWGSSPVYRKLGINSSENGMYQIVGFCHSLGTLAEVGDGRADNPCLCDEEIYQTVLKNVRKWIEANPECRVVSVTQDDTYNRCQCEKCVAMEEAKNPSGLMLTFVNRLADDIKDDYPDVKILTFAYHYTRKPPKTIKARDNVLIWLCSIECCFHHTLDDPTCEYNKAFADDIEAWADYCDHMYIWDYTTDYAKFTYTYPNFNVLRQNAAFFAEHRATGLYEEGDYPQLENAEFSRLRCYLLGKLLWNPYMSEEEYNRLMDEFLEDYYGAGWRAIRFYIDKTSESLKDCLNTFANITADSFETDYDALAACFQFAIEAAQDEETRKHCEISALQCECMYTDDPRDIPVELFQKLHDAGVNYIGEGDLISGYLPAENG